MSPRPRFALGYTAFCVGWILLFLSVMLYNPTPAPALAAACFWLAARTFGRGNRWIAIGLGLLVCFIAIGQMVYLFAPRNYALQFTVAGLGTALYLLLAERTTRATSRSCRRLGAPR